MMAKVYAKGNVTGEEHGVKRKRNHSLDEEWPSKTRGPEEVEEIAGQHNLGGPGVGKASADKPRETEDGEETRSLEDAKALLREWAHQCHLPDSVSAHGSALLERIAEQNSLSLSSPSIAAALYMASCQRGHSLTHKDVSTACRVSLPSLALHHKALAAALCGSGSPLAASEAVDKFCVTNRLPADVNAAARALLVRAQEMGLVTGGGCPLSLAMAALVMVNGCTEKDVVNLSGISLTSVQDCLRQLKDREGQLLQGIDLPDRLANQHSIKAGDESQNDVHGNHRDNQSPQQGSPGKKGSQQWTGGLNGNEEQPLAADHNSKDSSTKANQRQAPTSAEIIAGAGETGPDRGMEEGGKESKDISNGRGSKLQGTPMATIRKPGERLGYLPNIEYTTRTGTLLWSPPSSLAKGSPVTLLTAWKPPACVFLAPPSHALPLLQQTRKRPHRDHQMPHSDTYYGPTESGARLPGPVHRRKVPTPSPHNQRRRPSLQPNHEGEATNQSMQAPGQGTQPLLGPGASPPDMAGQPITRPLEPGPQPIGSSLVSGMKMTSQLPPAKAWGLSSGLPAQTAPNKSTPHVDTTRQRTPSTQSGQRANGKTTYGPVNRYVSTREEVQYKTHRPPSAPTLGPGTPQSLAAGPPGQMQGRRGSVSGVRGRAGEVELGRDKEGPMPVYMYPERRGPQQNADLRGERPLGDAHNTERRMGLAGPDQPMGDHVMLQYPLTNGLPGHSPVMRMPMQDWDSKGVAIPRDDMSVSARPGSRPGPYWDDRPHHLYNGVPGRVQMQSVSQSYQPQGPMKSMPGAQQPYMHGPPPSLGSHYDPREKGGDWSKRPREEDVRASTGWGSQSYGAPGPLKPVNSTFSVGMPSQGPHRYVGPAPDGDHPRRDNIAYAQPVGPGGPYAHNYVAEDSYEGKGRAQHPVVFSPKTSQGKGFVQGGMGATGYGGPGPGSGGQSMGFQRPVYRAPPSAQMAKYYRPS